MEKGRNSSGQFVKGHSGFKPKGAASKKQVKREQLFDYILNALGSSIAESLPAMSPNKVMRLYLQLLKLSVPKMARIPYVPEKQASKPSKVKYVIKNQA